MLKNREYFEKFIEDYKSGLFTYKDGVIYRNFRTHKGKTILVDEPIPSLNKCAQGYIRMYYKGKTLKSHRLVYAIHYGVEALFNCQCIDHIDGNKSNNKIENLRGLSIKENTLEAEKLGLYKRTYGNVNGMCKYDKDFIDKIINDYNSSNLTQYQIAKKYGVSQPYVSELVNKKKRRYA